jgi:hypothetical protein
LNSCCLALLDANIPLKYTFAAVSIGFIKESHQVLYFPDLEQEKVKNKNQLTLNKKKKLFYFQQCNILMTFVFDSVNQDLIFIDTTGLYTQKQFNYLYDNSKSYSKNIFNSYRKIIMNKYSKFIN